MTNHWGERPDVTKDEIAFRAILAVYGEKQTVDALKWLSTAAVGIGYEATTRNAGVGDFVWMLHVLVTPDGAAIVTSRRTGSACFVCACGEMLTTMRIGGDMSPPGRFLDEIARLAEDPDGPAAVCSSCAHKRKTLPSPVPTFSRAASHASP